MARGRDDWPDRYDMSAEQVFASFWALPLSIPAHLVAVEGARRLLIESTNLPVSPAAPWAVALAQTLILLASWAAEVGLLANLATRRRIGWKVSPLIIGYNWSIFMSRMAQGLLIGAFMLLSFPQIAQLSTIFVAAFSVWLRWGVLKRSLDTSTMGTVGVIILLLIVSTAVSLVLSILLQTIGLIPPPPAT